MNDVFGMDARVLRESLRKSQANCDQMVAIYGSLDRRLSALDSTIRPAVVHTDAIGKVSRNIDLALKSADVFLRHFTRIREAEVIIQKGPHEDLQAYLTTIDQLRSLDTSKTFRDDPHVTSHIRILLSEAVLKLEEEFKRLLSAHSQPLDHHSFVEDPNSVEDKNMEADDGKVYRVTFLISKRTSPMLHDLALQMVQSGMHKECVQAYRENHAPALELTLRNLGFEYKEEIERWPLESLEAIIGTWLYTMRIAVKSLFIGEKQVCRKIFYGIDSLAELCFATAIENSVQLLLSFGYTMVKREWPPEKLFILLDMYKAIHELQSEVEELLAEEACREMRDRASNMILQFARTARISIDEFKKNINEDANNFNILDAPVHPLTSYVINYFGLLGSEYCSTLHLLFDENDSGRQPNRHLVTVMMMILNTLVSNLERKSKKFNEPALSHLFLMNNINHVVNKLRRSSAEDLIDSDWVPRHRKIVQQNANQYLRVAWMPILQTLKIQTGSEGGSAAGSGSGSGISRSAIRERFRAFNSQFEELIQRQSHWTVPDPELRENLRLLVAEAVLPAYGNFIKRNGFFVEGSRNQERFLKFRPEDVQQMIDNLFQGGVSLQPNT
ncbi:exocyst complex component EXO70A1-like isoform X1 [Wolffia australiana]